MPCRYYTEAEEAQMREQAEMERDQMIDDLTAMLCATCRLLKKNGLLIGESEAGKWYSEHQKMDAARIKSEREAKAKRRAEAKLKEQALVKLTPEEKQALGIKDK